jgi:peptide/nickel transport system permease protein
MLVFAVKRVVALIPILIGISIVTFALLLMIPGNPVDVMLPPDTPPEVREEYKRELNLDDRVDQRYVAWIAHVVRGDFGTSIVDRVPASEVMLNALGNTAELAVAGMLIATILGIGFGLAMGWWAERPISRVLNAIVIGTSSVPQFWFGLILMYVFAVELQWLPTGGMGPLSLFEESPSFFSRIEYLVLPAITVAILPLAIIARLTRALFLEIRQQEFVLALRTRGYSTARIWRHLLRNAAPGVVNITGLQIGYGILGTLFAEIVFSWPGIGRAIADSIDARDYPVIQTIVLVTGALFASITILVDLAMRLLDPRVEID